MLVEYPGAVNTALVLLWTRSTIHRCAAVSFRKHSRTAVNAPRLPTQATIPESGICKAYRKSAILNSVVIPLIVSQMLSCPTYSYPQMLRKSSGGAPVNLLEFWQIHLSKDQTHYRTEVNVPRLPTPATIPETGICEAYRQYATLTWW